MKTGSRVVNDFAVGDGIVLYGWEGTVAEIHHEMRDKYDSNGEVIGKQPCTYLKVNFSNPKAVGYQYEGGWFGGSDGVVAYGYIER